MNIHWFILILVLISIFTSSYTQLNLYMHNNIAVIVSYYNLYFHWYSSLSRFFRSYVYNVISIYKITYIQIIQWVFALNQILLVIRCTHISVVLVLVYLNSTDQQHIPNNMAVRLLKFFYLSNFTTLSLS